MGAAEGEVQEKGYEASFPSLVNIAGEPTYIMVLKDANGLVKLYALVNVRQYNIVATGETQASAIAAYTALLAQNGVDTSQTVVGENKTVTVGHVGVFRIYLQNFLVQNRNNICHREHAAHMATSGLICHSHGVNADLLCQCLTIFHSSHIPPFEFQMFLHFIDVAVHGDTAVGGNDDAV